MGPLLRSITVVAAGLVSLQVGATLGAAAITRPQGAARAVGTGCALVAFVTPASLDVDPLLAFVLTLCGVLTLGRTLDLALRPPPLRSGWHRLWFSLSLFDVARAQRVPSRTDRAAVAGVFRSALVVAGATGMILGVAPQIDDLDFRTLTRWLGGGLFMLSAPELLQETHLLCYRALGLEVVPLQRQPWRARSLGEFWGRRWNRLVSGWLHRYAFRPLARRRRPRLGLFAAFGLSAALHFWVAFVPLDLAHGLVMASFFVVHGIAVVLEGPLGVARWPPFAGHAWTLAWLAASSPLFVDPMLRIAGW